jgi:hypothetical protein
LKEKKFFPYGETETAYLSKKDKRLKRVIEVIGPIEREMDGPMSLS